MASDSQHRRAISPFAMFQVDFNYFGPVAEVILADEASRMFRTRLRDAAKKSVNFAGEYVLTTWGCGAGCVDGAVVSLKTGEVTFLPLIIHVGLSERETMQFYDNSRLLIMRGAVDEGGEIAEYFYAFTHGHFRKLKPESVRGEGEQFWVSPVLK